MSLTFASSTMQECSGVGERVFAIVRYAGGDAFRTSTVGVQSGPTFQQSAPAWETQPFRGVALTVEVELPHFL